VKARYNRKSNRVEYNRDTGRSFSALASLRGSGTRIVDKVIGPYSDATDRLDKLTTISCNYCKDLIPVRPVSGEGVPGVSPPIGIKRSAYS
jgi:hypothetical protein